MTSPADAGRPANGQARSGSNVDAASGEARGRVMALCERQDPEQPRTGLGVGPCAASDTNHYPTVAVPGVPGRLPFVFRVVGEP
jgi:hypothetical protein